MSWGEASGKTLVQSCSYTAYQGTLSKDRVGLKTSKSEVQK